MANVTITGLSPAAALTGTEVLAIDQTGSTVKTTVQDVANLAGVGFPVIQNQIQYINNSTIYSYENNQTTLSQELRFPNLTSVTRFFKLGYGIYSSITSAPNLTTIGQDLIMYFDTSSLTHGTTIEFPSLVSVGSELSIVNANLTSLNLSSLTTVGRFNITSCPSLTSINLSSLTTIDNTQNQNFSTNALNEATVNAILVKIAAIAPVASGGPSIYLNGGINASPTGAGLTAKATLQSGGWNVNTN